MKFKEFNFHESLSEGLEAMGFQEATPVQEQAIPKILEGKDLIACAQTGTGKTAAFVLPVLHKIASQQPSHTVKTLIIAPTRELAQQIDQQIEGFSYFTHASSLSIYGGGDGQAWDTQKTAIREGVDVLVATPGRLISLLQSKHTNLEHIQTLILDEADRMLDMGFADDIKRIIAQLPKNRQTLLFSATMPAKIKELAKAILTDPDEISLAISKPAEGIFQKAFLTYDGQKTPLLKHILDYGAYNSAIIFAGTKEKVKSLERELKGIEQTIKAFHSDLDQSQREEIMSAFKARKINILIGTDILSRGIDVENIELVVNYDVPPDAEDYVHRIGRTARASTSGEAVTFINEKDMSRFAQIEKLIEREVIKTQKLPKDLGEGPEYRVRERRAGKPGGRPFKGGKRRK